MKKLASLMIIAVLAACAPSHCPHCATKQSHQECCGAESGYCPHAQGGAHAHGKPDHKHPHPHADHKPGKKPCHGAAHKDYDVKHDAEWHNANH